MGPIEAELRTAPNGNVKGHNWLWGISSIAAFREATYARRRLGFESLEAACGSKAIPDVLSEAIEAAEALGL